MSILLTFVRFSRIQPVRVPELGGGRGQAEEEQEPAGSRQEGEEEGRRKGRGTLG